MGVFNFPNLFLKTNPVLPTTYDDTLSYYETLGKVATNLNKISEGMNSLADALVSPYAESKIYNKGDYAWENEKLYKCNSDNVTGDWNVAKWDEVVFTDSIANDFKNYQALINLSVSILNTVVENVVKSIAPEYSEDTKYYLGDYVSYNGKLYTCIVSSTYDFISDEWESIEALPYSTTTPYYVGAYCIYAGSLYICTHDTIGEFNENYWGNCNVTPFRNDTKYNVDDYVIYGSTYYKCIVNSTGEFDEDEWREITVVEDLNFHVEKLWNDFFTEYQRTWGITDSLGNSSALAISQKGATDAIGSIRAVTQNKWIWGNQYCNGEKVDILNITIPAGTYTLSAIATNNSTANKNCRIYFFAEQISTSLANPFIRGDGERHSTTFTLAQDCHSIRIVAGLSNTDTNIVTWENVQLELGNSATIYTEPGYTAIDKIARGYIADKNNDITNIPVISNRLNDVSEKTNNLWEWGNQHCEGTKIQILNISIPAGTYTLSAKVFNNGSNINSRILFYSGQFSNELARPYLPGDGERHNVTFTLARDCNSMTILPGLAESSGYDVIWNDVQLESGTEATPYFRYGYTAIDQATRKYISDNEEMIATIPTITHKLNLITEPSNNIWKWGNQHCEGTKIQILNISIPAGTYTLSAKVFNNGSNINSRILFYAGQISNELARPFLPGDGERHNVTFTLAQDCNSITILPGLAESSGLDVIWNDVQLEEGIYETAYSDEYSSIDSKARSLANLLTFAVKDFIGTHTNTTITIPVNQYGGKNTPIVCTIDAKYQTTTTPPLFRSYIITDRGFERGSRYYVVGNDVKYSIKSFRSVPYIWDSRTVYLQLVVPNGCTVYVKNAYCENSAQINSNYSLKFFAHDGCCSIAPPQTLPAYKMAQASGYSSGIIIPKISSTGVWFAYHDDTYNNETTHLRTANGEKPSATYNGMLLSEVPWDYLQTLYYTTFGKQFEEEQVMLVSDFLEFCSLTGFEPTFSMHPFSQMTSENIQSLYSLVDKYNLVNKLTIKCPVIWDDANNRYSTAGITRMFAVFGNKVKQYTLNAAQGMSDPTIIVDMMNTLTNITTRKVVEFWQTQLLSNTESYTSAIITAKSYGLDVGCACSAILTPDELSTIINMGVNEFTDDTNTSNGLNWYN